MLIHSFMGPLVNIPDFARHHALDAKARGICEADFLLVEQRAAQDMILTAKHRAVKINLCDDLFCTGKVHRCCNADLGLQHAADHALHAINLRSGSNFSAHW